MHASLNRRLKEGAFLLLLAIGIYFLMALFSYSPKDPSWGYVGPREHAAVSYTHLRAHETKTRISVGGWGV